jgi:hypothetical protein
MPPAIVPHFTVYRYRVLREDSGGVKESAVMLSAVEAMTKPDSVGPPRGHDPDLATLAAAGESVHAISPPIPDYRLTTA